jgi:hypothetical protein
MGLTITCIFKEFFLYVKKLQFAYCEMGNFRFILVSKVMNLILFLSSDRVFYTKLYWDFVISNH